MHDFYILSLHDVTTDKRLHIWGVGIRFEHWQRTAVLGPKRCHRVSCMAITRFGEDNCFLDYDEEGGGLVWVLLLLLLFMAWVFFLVDGHGPNVGAPLTNNRKTGRVSE